MEINELVLSSFDLQKKIEDEIGRGIRASSLLDELILLRGERANSIEEKMKEERVDFHDLTYAGGNLDGKVLDYSFSNFYSSKLVKLIRFRWDEMCGVGLETAVFVKNYSPVVFYRNVIAFRNIVSSSQGQQILSFGQEVEKGIINGGCDLIHDGSSRKLFVDVGSYEKPSSIRRSFEPASPGQKKIFVNPDFFIHSMRDNNCFRSSSEGKDWMVDYNEGQYFGGSGPEPVNELYIGDEIVKRQVKYWQKPFNPLTDMVYVPELRQD